MPGYPRPRNVTATPLAELAALIEVSVTGADDVAVTGVTHDSASIRAGDLYAALPGSRVHGSRFVADAAAAGAVAVLTDPEGAAACAGAGLPALVVASPRAVLGAVASRVYGEPTRSLTLIGITGTAGKTSTTYLIESGLRAAGHVTGLIGTVETRLGEQVLDSARTTPEATDLHALFAAAIEEGVDSVVMEVSSHALQLDRVGGVRFRVGGFTNLGLDHLDFHADVDEYFAAKARLFDGRCDIEILNADDAAGRRLAEPHSLTYSALGSPDVTWYATGVREDDFAQRFTAHGPDGIAVDAGVSLPGRHNVANALLALACLVAVGVDPKVAADGIAACAGSPGRMERVTAPGPVLGVVDYAHKPDAIVEVLAALRHVAATRGPDGLNPARVICVLGAGGDRDKGKRSLMGAAAARGADVVIVTDDNPRTEDPAEIRAGVKRGAQSAGDRPNRGPAEVVEVDGRRQAIAAAVAMAEPGDVIALLGKGHERGQEVGGETRPFDDRVELAAALTARFGPASTDTSTDPDTSTDTGTSTDGDAATGGDRGPAGEPDGDGA